MRVQFFLAGDQKEETRKKRKRKKTLSLPSHLVPRRPGPAVEQHRDRRRPSLPFPVLLLRIASSSRRGRRGKPNVGHLPLPRPIPHPLDEPPFFFRSPPLREGPEGKGDQDDLSGELLGDEPGVPGRGGEAGGEVRAVAELGLFFFLGFFFEVEVERWEIERGGRIKERGETKLFLSLSLSLTIPPLRASMRIIIYRGCRSRSIDRERKDARAKKKRQLMRRNSKPNRGRRKKKKTKTSIFFFLPPTCNKKN